jgi:signal peptidase
MPKNFGGDTRYEPVLTGSMEPAIPVGGVVLIKPVEPEMVDVGDIICFKFSESTLITHRVARIIEDGFVTKGDANEDFDLKIVNPSEVVGKVVLILPLIGFIGTFAQSTLGFIVLLLIPAVSIIVYETKSIIDELRKKKTLT